VAGRASIVGAAATHVGKVRDHNEDAHFFDADLGVFLVCDGMGGHAAGEVASALAIREICAQWGSDGLRDAAAQWLERSTPSAKKRLIEVVRAGVLAAHHAILTEADLDDAKSGMGTTLVGALIVGGELVFAHAGDSRAYLVRDGISMQLTEDHTLLARLLAAGIDVDLSGEGARFRSMLTNALGIGEQCRVSTFVVPLADGDRFLLCSDGISEYVPENEVGEVLTKQTSPARAAQRLIDLALERGGGDNATAVVMRVLEAGETPAPAEQRRKDDAAINACPLWGRRVTLQQRLRALRIAIARDYPSGDTLPPHTLGDRVAWIVVDGELVQDGRVLGPGAFVYPESLVNGRDAAPLPDRDAVAITKTDVRALAIRADDFRELCDDDGELGEALLDSLATVLGSRLPRAVTRDTVPRIDTRAATDPALQRLLGRDGSDVRRPSDPQLSAMTAPLARDRATTVPGGPAPRARTLAMATTGGESAIIAPVSRRATSPQVSARPSPLPAPLSPRVPTPAQAAHAVSKPPVAGPPPAAPAMPGTPPGGTPRQIRAEPAIAASPPVLAEATPDTEFESPRLAVRSRSQAHTLAASAPRSVTPLPAPVELVAAPPAAAPSERTRRRPPSFPEIEAYYEIEMEAELPPESGNDPDLESELALSIALSGHLEGDPEMSITYGDSEASVTYDDDATEVMQTMIHGQAFGSLDQTLVTEPMRTRAITAEDGAVSGTISTDEMPTLARRARRHSESRED